MTIPSKISGFRSRAINALIDAVARYRPLPGPGLLATEGPGGTVLSLARPPASGSADLPQAWDVRIALDTESEDLVWRLTFLRAIVVRGPVTRVYPTDPQLELPLDASTPYSDYWCGAEFDVETMLVTVRVSKLPSDVFDTTVPVDYSRVRRLLYKLRASRPDEEQTAANTTWAVTEDYRTAFGLEVYV